MLGRVRTSSSSSLEVLEMERAASTKLIKDDSLSIYEATLMKLKQGSCRDMSTAGMELNHVEAISANGEDAMIVDTENSSSDSSPTSSSCHSIDTLKEQRSKNVSVLYLFSRYNKS